MKFCLILCTPLICLVDVKYALEFRNYSGSGNLSSSYLVCIHGREMIRILMSFPTFCDKTVSQWFDPDEIPS